MNNKDWIAKVLLQKDLSFIEHIQNQSNDVNEEDKMIARLDGDDPKSEEDQRLIEKKKLAKKIVKKLSKENQVILAAWMRSKNFESLSHILGVSLSTAWKRVQKVKKEIEEIKCQMNLK